MANYKKLYFALFNRLSKLMEELAAIQIEAEELYLREEEPEPHRRKEPIDRGSIAQEAIIQVPDGANKNNNPWK